MIKPGRKVLKNRWAVGYAMILFPVISGIIPVISGCRVVEESSLHQYTTLESGVR